MVGMADRLNHMIASLAAMAAQVGDASARIESTLSQVRAALATQASGAAQQASATAQTSATLEEIRVTSSQTLEKAEFLGQISERARVESERGAKAVGEAVAGMGLVRQKVEAVAAAILELSQKNHQIGAITDAVDELAVQSRMLALNASIEAAKAGEAGLGFAVVAEEIRNLAEQSRSATTQVKAILQAIQSTSDHVVMVAEEGTKQVVVGGALAQQAGEVIDSLSAVVRQSAASSQQIGTVVRQESAGIDQIAQAMSEIARTVTLGVTAVRQTEQAMNDLDLISQQLKQRVGAYRV
jgi:methyl-accepting chemotaxis protein